jgi:hypothetical protein
MSKIEKQQAMKMVKEARLEERNGWATWCPEEVKRKMRPIETFSLRGRRNTGALYFEFLAVD